MSCKLKLPSVALLYLSLACGLATANWQGPVAADWEKQAEELNVLIDGLKSAEERQRHRSEVYKMMSAVKIDSYHRAASEALTQSATAPSAELRKKWGQIAKKLQAVIDRRNADIEVRIERYLGNLNEVWTADSVEKIDKYQAALGTIPEEYDLSKKYSELAPTQKAVAGWREALQKKLEGDFDWSMKCVTSLPESVRDRIDEKLRLALLNELRQGMSKRLSKFVREARARITIARSEVELQAALAWTKEQAPSLYATRSAEGYEEAMTLHRFAEKWHQALQAEQRGSFQTAHTLLESVRELAVKDLLTEELDVKQRALLTAEQDAVKAFAEESRRRLVSVKSSDEARRARDWINYRFDRLKRDSPRFQVAFDMMMAANCWVMVFEEKERRRFKSAIRELDDFQKKKPVVIPHNDVLDLRNSLIESAESYLQNAIENALKRIFEAESAAEARPIRDRVVYLEHYLEHYLDVPDSKAIEQAKSIPGLSHHWTTYLSASERGNHEAAMQAISAVSSIVSKNQLPIDPSAGKKIEQAKTRLKVIAANHLEESERQKLLNFEKAMAEFDDNPQAALQAGYNMPAMSDSEDENRANTQLLREDVENLISIKKSLSNGTMKNVESLIRGRRSRLRPHPWTKWTNQRALLLVFPILASTSDLGNVKPAEGDTISSLLMRAAETAAKERDWARVDRVLNIYLRLEYREYHANPNAVALGKACRLLIDGERFAIAGDLAAAKAAYENVQKMEDAPVAKEAAAEKVKTLQEVQP